MSEWNSTSTPLILRWDVVSHVDNYLEYCRTRNFLDVKMLQICDFDQFWHLICAHICIEEVHSCQPVFKSSKSDHYQGSYGHLKLTKLHPTTLGYPLAILCMRTFRVLHSILHTIFCSVKVLWTVPNKELNIVTGCLTCQTFYAHANTP